MAHGLLPQQQRQYYINKNNYGNYQFISLPNIINNFMATYVGEGKILSNVNRGDVSFHAHRALQELSYDTLKSVKSQEIEIPASLTMILPHDYVNYVKLTWSDDSGIEHVIYPARKTSNPTPILQNSDGDYRLDAEATITTASSSIVLDGEYKNIIVGMQVDGAASATGGYGVPDDATVYSTSNSGGITTISLEVAGTVYVPLQSFTETLIFHNGGGSKFPVLQEESSHIVESLSWNTTDFRITAASTSAIGSIKVGMLVSNVYFPAGTTVVDIIDNIITTSAKADTPVTSGGEVTFLSDNILSDTWSNYKSASSSNNINPEIYSYDSDIYDFNIGKRYGLDPQHAHANGSFFIDDNTGLIHFSSNISGKTISLKYISDNVGIHDDMQVHKFAEEAIYKWIAYGCLIARINTPEYVIARFKREKFAETRKAKLRLSNLKLEEITQVLRGKSKHIKH